MQDTPKAPQRLDSWKEIAAYLGRDVRTAMRWAKSQGLPVRRVAGGRGHSVFGFSSEIDDWLKGQTSKSAADSAPALDPVPVPASLPDVIPVPAPAARPLAHRVARWGIGVLALVGAAVLVASAVPWPGADPFDVKVSVDGNGVAITNSRGATHIVQLFDANQVAPIQRMGGDPTAVADINDDHVPDVLLSASYRRSSLDAQIRSGEMIAMTTGGDVRWRYELDDTVRFKTRTFSSPWSVVDWQASPGPGRRQIAVAAHHYIWWPGLLTLLDEAGRRVGFFVNAGWIEHVQWIDNGRILISGFDNARDGGMVALLDAHHPNGHAPDAADAQYVCQSCPTGDPLLFIVFPRSEVNRAGSAPFNRAQTQLLSDRIVVTTTELTGDNVEIPTALYEFDLHFNFLSATYGDRYWDAHHRLELQGLIDHTRENCLRTQPGPIQVWTRAGGWRQVKPGQSLLVP